jgi:hypothetical protein
MKEKWAIFSSPELKWAFLIARRPSVRPSVCPSVNFYIFDFFSRTTGPILTRLGTNHSWVKGIQVCSNKGPGRLQRGDNHKNGMGSFKSLFLQNHWANFNQTWHKSSWRERIQVSLKEGDSPSPRGDNSERVKIHRNF